MNTQTFLIKSLAMTTYYLLDILATTIEFLGYLLTLPLIAGLACCEVAWSVVCKLRDSLEHYIYH